MSRLYTSKNSSRQQGLFSAPRTSQRRAHPDDTYQEKPQKKKRRGGAKVSTAVPTKRRTKKVAASITEDESTSSGDEADGESDEDEEEEPLPVAPSRAPKEHKTGHYKARQSAAVDLSDAGDNMFELAEFDDFGDYQKAKQGVQVPDVADRDFVEQLFAGEDDDDVYQGVEDISDSDIDPDKIERADQLAFEETLELDGFDDADSTWDPLNHIEGMSAYGFGASDTEGTVQYFPSSQSSDEGGAAIERRVRFQDAFPEVRMPFTATSGSPTMARALLPSALGSLAEDPAAASDSESYDSELTDDCLPDISLRTPKNSQTMQQENSPSQTSDSAKRTPRLKGPPSGTFIDDGIKTSGILDKSGKMLIITNPHCLGEQFAKRYAASAPQSPSASFAEAVFDDNASQVSREIGPLGPDLMLSSLNTAASAAANGQVEGPPYAFFPQPSDYTLALELQNDEFEGSEFAELSADEAAMNIDDVIQWGSETDEESPISPIVMSNKSSMSMRTSDLAHLNNNNIMSFRRNADPNFAALHSSPLTPNYGKFGTPKSRSKKRKERTDSPYNHAHYKGVTPVQRMTRAEPEPMDGSPGPSSKRRRVMT